MTEPGLCWPLTPAVTSPLILFLDQTSLCAVQPATACACSCAHTPPPSPPASDIIFTCDYVMTQMDYTYTWNKRASRVYLQKSGLTQSKSSCSIHIHLDALLFLLLSSSFDFYFPIKVNQFHKNKTGCCTWINKNKKMILHHHSPFNTWDKLIYWTEKRKKRH